MRCVRCGREVAALHDPAAGLCSACHEGLPPEDRHLMEAAATARLERERRDSRVRSVWAVLTLSFVTLGVYYLYWLWENLRELREAAPGRTVPARAGQWLFGIKVLVILSGLVAGVVWSLSLLGDASPLEAVRLPWPFLLLSGIEIFVDAVFYALFTAAVGNGQRAAGLEPLSVTATYLLYLAYAALQAGASATVLRSGGAPGAYGLGAAAVLQLLEALPEAALLSAAASLCFLAFIVRVQNGINRIWAADPPVSPAPCVFAACAADRFSSRAAGA